LRLLSWARSQERLDLLSKDGFVQGYGAGVDRILGAPALSHDIPISRIVDKHVTQDMTQHIDLAVLRWF
jgi:hypothetical protein